MDATVIEAGLRQQGIWCGEFGSPFTAALCAKMADDYRAGGIVADILSGWPTDPVKDALALRLAGGLHYAALKEPKSAIGEAWPKGHNVWTMETAWAAAVALMKERRDWMRAFIASPPQTNEVRRAAALFPGICAAAAGFNGPIDLLELGASAGLNLNMDQFHYCTGAWTYGDGDAQGVVIDTQWRGPAPPIFDDLAIRRRAACDQNPLDPADSETAMRLNAYVWPDQPERVARLKGAIDLAAVTGVRVDKADAADWLMTKLATRATDALTIVYHSIFLIYPDAQTRDRIIELMEMAGAQATAEAPLAWLRMEWPGVLGLPAQSATTAVLELIQWPGGKRTVLAEVDPHARWVTWFDQ